MCAALVMALGIPSPFLKQTGVAARVNNTFIPEEEYARILLATQQGLKRKLTAEDRKQALQTLIDEELIFQEALVLGLARKDPAVRKNLIQTLIQGATFLAVEKTPDEETLRAFYDKQKNFFQASTMVTITAVETDAENISDNFSNALRQGKLFNQSVKEYGLKPLAIPDNIPLAKVSDYLGGQVSDAVNRMQKDDIAGPFIVEKKQVFLWLKNKSSDVSSYEEREDQVRKEWIRREEEKALSDYLERLRRSAKIQYVISPDEPYL